MRAVLDTNVIVSALLSTDGSPARLLAAWKGGGFELIVSPLLLGELGRVLAYPKVRKHVDPADADELLRLLVADAVVATDRSFSPPVVPPDPTDAFIIVLAMEESAVLVTGDRGLLGLNGDLPIKSPAAFLAELD